MRLSPQPRGQWLPPEITYVPGNKTGCALVWLPGMGNDGPITAGPLLGCLTRFGDVLVLSYPTSTFDQVEMQRLIEEHSRGYKGIILIGLSIGAMVAVNYMRWFRDVPEFVEQMKGVVLVDGLTCAADVKQPLRWVNRWPLKHVTGGGRFWTRIWPALFWIQEKFFPPPGLEPEVDTEYAKRHRHAMRHFHSAGYFAQWRAVVANDPILPGEFKNLPAALVECNGDDDFVKDESEGRLRGGFPKAITYEGSSAHASPVEHPNALGRAISDAMEFTIWPLAGLDPLPR